MSEADYVENYLDVKSRITGRIACDQPAAVLLQETVARVGGDYIEIGTLFGGTAILAAMMGVGKVYAIDPVDGYYNPGQVDKTTMLVPSVAIFEENMRRFGVEVTLFPHKHPPWPDAIKNNRFGIGFIDGDHGLRGAQLDYRALRSRCECIIFDNVEKPAVQTVVDEATAAGWFVYETIGYPHKITEKRKGRMLKMTVMTLEDPADEASSE